MRTLSCTCKLVRAESDSQRRGARTLALNIDVMKGRGSTDSRREKMEADRKGESSEGGTWGDQSGISESIPCWTV